MKRCPDCKGIYSDKDFNCLNCGSRLIKDNFQFTAHKPTATTTPTPSIITCPACQGKVSNQAKSCPHCGQPINTQIICPKCNSSDIESIGGFKKGASALAFGVFSANTVLNNYKCRKCGHKFK